MIPALSRAALSFSPTYHGPGERCPGCNASNWHVGRIVAECAMCGTALPIAETYSQPAEPRFVVTRTRSMPSGWKPWRNA